MSTLSRYTLNQGHALFLFLMIFLVIMSDIFNIVNQIRTRKLFMQIIFCFNPSICFLSNLLGFCRSYLGLCLLYLMGAIMHAQASTRLIGLIRVENSMHHFYLWQLLLLSFLQRHSWRQIDSLECLEKFFGIKALCTYTYWFSCKLIFCYLSHIFRK